MLNIFFKSFCVTVVMFCLQAAAGAEPHPLPGTQPLTIEGDIASQMVDGIDRFLLRETEESVARRERHYDRDFSSPEAYAASLKPNRERLAHILGLRDPRIAFDSPELVATLDRPAKVGRAAGYEIYSVRWPAVEGVDGEGLLLRPEGKPLAAIIAIPDASQTPEQIAGLSDGVAAESQFARRLAETGCMVVVPALIDRRADLRGHRKIELTRREFLYRPAFELGRTLIGYELQKVLSLVDSLAAAHPDLKIGVMGYGEGGMLALYAAAVDQRIDAACVSGFFDDRSDLWQEPIDRNVFGLLDQFGGAELAAMVTPRPLIIEAAKAPEQTIATRGGAPGRIVTPDLGVVKREVERANQIIAPLKNAAQVELVVSDDGGRAFGTSEAMQKLLAALGAEADIASAGEPPQQLAALDDPAARQQRLMRQIEQHTQRVLTHSPYVRQAYMKDLDTSSLAKYEASAAVYRRRFYDEVIGRFDDEPLPFNARSRRAYEGEQWIGYDVVLDVFPDVIAYGVLLLPKDLKEGERRPVVVCQHGLEGTPQKLFLEDHRAYHKYAAQLADRGYVVFVPQNPYIFGNRFRQLQRKANPLGKSLFSIITPQHQQIVDWLQTQPFVDGERIALYGLSYGGKTAMRVPAIVTDYSVSICSGDFNEWVWKNASTHPRNQYTFVHTKEYEMFEWDLGSTFNYAEMAALIAPRPFMVERGHFDGVAPDEAVAHEFAKVRHLYAAKLKIPDRAEIEWFVGGHEIHSTGTFEFLDKHLNWTPR